MPPLKVIRQVANAFCFTTELLIGKFPDRDTFSESFRDAERRSRRHIHNMDRFFNLRRADPNNNDIEDKDKDKDKRQGENILSEVQRKIGEHFDLKKAIKLAIDFDEYAYKTINERKEAMAAIYDVGGIIFLRRFADEYPASIVKWRAIQGYFSEQ